MSQININMRKISMLIAPYSLLTLASMKIRNWFYIVSAHVHKFSWLYTYIKLLYSVQKKTPGLKFWLRDCFAENCLALGWGADISPGTRNFNFLYIPMFLLGQQRNVVANALSTSPVDNYSSCLISVSVLYSLNPDPAKNLNPDPDPSYFLSLSKKI